MEQNKKRNWIAIVLGIVLVLSVVVNCILITNLAELHADSSRSLYDSAYAVGNKNETVVEDPEGTVPYEPIEISNRYFTFVCPEDLREVLRVEVQEQDSGVANVFIGLISGKEQELFMIELTKAEPEGYLLGEFTDSADGQFHVVMHMNEIDSNGWSENEYDQISDLQQRVNDFIVQFYEDARFAPSR